MRTLLLTRGCPSSGKSTWIKENNLEPYTLSADNIRLLMQSPDINLNGQPSISQVNDKKVWDLLFELLEKRMQNGDFTVIDATHYKKSLFNRYKNLIKQYKYRAFIIDFTDVSREVCIERNKKRELYKQVPEETINKMCSVFEFEKTSDFKEIGSSFTVIKPDDVKYMLKPDYLLSDYTSKYEKIIVFGDIHGCYEPLHKYFEKDGFNKNYLYIFTGDYLDRGIQNLEVLQFLIKVKDYKNVILLEGNHENWLQLYSSKNSDDFKKIKSREFINYTVPQISGLNKKDIRQVCRKFSQMQYFKFGNKKYVVCHGGISCLPNITISTNQFVQGIGKYEDELECGINFLSNTEENIVLIHAHRNVFDKPIKYNDFHYNLCDKIENGGNLRILDITPDGLIKQISIPNNVYRNEPPKFEHKYISDNSKPEDILESLNKSKYVNKKDLGNNIVSYNFNRQCFNKSVWNATTCKARGLFVDLDTNKVISRGYSKFHNIDQTEDTKINNLYKNLQFPVKAYLKENGFIAFVSYNFKEDNLFIASKSTNSGEYVDMIKEEINKLDDTNRQYILNYCKENNCTLIFECINKDKDPHIIKYDFNHLVLLDIVKNEFKDEYFDFEEVKKVSNIIDVAHKQLEYTFNDVSEFRNWYNKIINDYSSEIEGYVIQDSNNFRTKFKTNYYKFWKYIRSLKDRVAKHDYVNPVFKNENEVLVYNFMRTLDKEELKNMSVIELRDKYLKSLQ